MCRIVTTDNYWDCECPDRYIHPIRRKECPLCGALEDEQPPSRVNELKESRFYIEDK